ncbi:MAG: M20/M25/M40 family metallo-hydrolase [Chitinophagaceae bacterium]|nr:M20/M25/M40 family metallo-hydrolase [Chitinophagaceae bacterium]MCA6452525.1 M20/M25/M40 family metallo-hydrolase [Chitinophagaceae bacterium]MCA6456473.1 M20/M25/M40 family metallo-hydrolase [Chitinophagaceae bacterium]MCA6459845.1 M20/M25/M40 family metallo-hydrolase [Chitinophagaceae bacterium]MCA6465954.1 M20/M25/M40 family metallo-hydrolase [Chitinophagaceae bacterium]
MKKTLTALLFLPLVGMAQTGDEARIKQLSDEIIRNGKAYELLRQLTKDIGGRLSGSPQFAKAVQWGKLSMEQNGADKVYLQECMIPHWVRGGQDKAYLVEIDKKKASQKLDVLALGNSLGSGTVTGELLAVADFDELEKRKDEVKGKIVYYNSGFNPTNIKPFVSYGESGIYRRWGASRAAKYGAIGVMIRSLTESTANDPHTGGMAYIDSFPKIPAIAVGPRDADKVWAMSKTSNMKLSMTTNGHFLPDTIGHNVIAELTGTEFPDQIITVGGHLDSWDVNEGAHDDGTGVVQTIEIMRALKAIGYQPKHTIRFVLFANEENGLRGGTKYAAEAKAKGEKHVFALESDAGGFTPRGFSIQASKAQLEKLRSWIPLLSPYGSFEITGDGGGADIGPLNRTFGIPVGELLPDPQRYFDLHHARSDVFENVNKRELLLGAVNMAGLIYLVDKYGL